MPLFLQTSLLRSCIFLQAFAAIGNLSVQAFVPEFPISGTSRPFLERIPIVQPSVTRYLPLKVSAIDDNLKISRTATSDFERKAQELGKAAQELLNSRNENLDACNNVLDVSSSCIADIYEDVGVIFESASAHGDGTLQLATLNDHLKMRTDSAEATSLIDGVMRILRNSSDITHGRTSVRHEEVTNAFARHISAQQLELSGSSL